MLSEEMYLEHILDHYKNPRNTGTIEQADIEHHDYNPTCGDEITFFLKLGKDQTVQDIKFLGKGCAISQASASLLSESLKGKALAEVKQVTNADVLELLGIPIGAVRMKCALLSLKAIEKGIRKFEGGTPP